MRRAFGLMLLVTAMGALSAAPSLAQDTIGGGQHGPPATNYEAPPERGFRINPQREYVRGVAAFQAKRYKSAVRVLARVTDADPGNADAWRILGAAYAAEGRWIASRSAYAHAIHLKPDEIVSHAGLGLALLELKSPKAEKEAQWLKARAKACGDTCPEAPLLKELETRGPFAPGTSG